MGSRIYLPLGKHGKKASHILDDLTRILDGQIALGSRPPDLDRPGKDLTFRLVLHAKTKTAKALSRLL